MTSAFAVSPAVRDAVDLIRDERAEIADAAAAVVTSMSHPDMVASLWPIARFGQRERHVFGVMFLHFVAGGLTADEQRLLDIEVAEHRRRRCPGAPFLTHRGRVR